MLAGCGAPGTPPTEGGRQDGTGRRQSIPASLYRPDVFPSPAIPVLAGATQGRGKHRIHASQQHDPKAQTWSTEVAVARGQGGRGRLTGMRAGERRTFWNQIPGMVLRFCNYTKDHALGLLLWMANCISTKMFKRKNQKKPQARPTHPQGNGSILKVKWRSHPHTLTPHPPVSALWSPQRL